MSNELLSVVGSAPLWTAIGGAVGLVGSVFVWRYIVWATEPSLELAVLPSTVKPQDGDGHPNGPHRFYHVLVRHRAPYWPFRSRSPAWAARATLDFFDDQWAHILGPIDARWPGQPEPVNNVLRNGKWENLLDPRLVFVGKRDDVHFHESRQDRVWINIALKFEGDFAFYVFSNESYLFNWCNPEWRLSGPAYYVRVRVACETGITERAFRLTNLGPGRGDLTLEHA